MKRLLLVPFVMLTMACGGGGDSPTAPPVPTPTPRPSARITATGAGALVLHPSSNPTWGVAMETPIRIQETAGGEADWNFARFSLYKGGVEIERGEIGADTIRAAGFSRVRPNSSEAYNVLFRFNSDDFDDVKIMLGFGDVNHGGQFTVEVPFSSFTGVNISLTPLYVPSSRIERLPLS